MTTLRNVVFIGNSSLYRAMGNTPDLNTTLLNNLNSTTLKSREALEEADVIVNFGSHNRVLPLDIMMRTKAVILNSMEANALMTDHVTRYKTLSSGNAIPMLDACFSRTAAQRTITDTHAAIRDFGVGNTEDLSRNFNIKSNSISLSASGSLYLVHKYDMCQWTLTMIGSQVVSYSCDSEKPLHEIRAGRDEIAHNEASGIPVKLASEAMKRTGLDVAKVVLGRTAKGSWYVIDCTTQLNLKAEDTSALAQALHQEIYRRTTDIEVYPFTANYIGGEARFGDVTHNKSYEITNSWKGDFKFRDDLGDIQTLRATNFIKQKSIPGFPSIQWSHQIGIKQGQLKIAKGSHVKCPSEVHNGTDVYRVLDACHSHVAIRINGFVQWMALSYVEAYEPEVTPEIKVDLWYKYKGPTITGLLTPNAYYQVMSISEANVIRVRSNIFTNTEVMARDLHPVAPEFIPNYFKICVGDEVQAINSDGITYFGVKAVVHSIHNNSMIVKASGSNQRVHYKDFKLTCKAEILAMRKEVKVGSRVKLKNFPSIEAFVVMLRSGNTIKVHEEGNSSFQRTLLIEDVSELLADTTKPLISAKYNSLSDNDKEIVLSLITRLSSQVLEYDPNVMG